MILSLSFRHVLEQQMITLARRVIYEPMLTSINTIVLLLLEHVSSENASSSY